MLGGSNSLPAGKEGAAQTIEKLGYIQIDTIAVIQRAHHHTLWTRRADYKPEMIYELQAKDRRVFEYWTHASSYLPMKDYRYYRHKMKNFDDPVSKWEKDRLTKYGYLMKPVLDRIRKEGPLGARDFESLPEPERNGSMYWKPAKMALDLLVLNGELMITERRNFQKIYDLTERVLPEDIAGKKLISASLQDLVETGTVSPVQIEHNEKNGYYALTDTIETIDSMNSLPPGIHFLSPFDNLIIQRERIKQVFNFDYALECYVKPDKRKYGYFVLPLLWGDRFIGRMDPAVDRKKQILFLRGLFFEPDIKDVDPFLNLFAEKLRNFARFNMCNAVKVEKIFPSRLHDFFKNFIRQMDPID